MNVWTSISESKVRDLFSTATRTQDMWLIHAVLCARLKMKTDLPKGRHFGGCVHEWEYSVLNPKTHKSSMIFVHVFVLNIHFHSYLTSTLPSSVFSEVEIFPATKTQRRWSYTVGTFYKVNDLMCNFFTRDPHWDKGSRESNWPHRTITSYLPHIW